MPRRQSTPDKRAADVKVEVAKYRRRYKQDTSKPKKLLPGEEGAAQFTCVVLKIAGYTNKQISAIVGVSKGQVKTFLETPEAQELLIDLRTKIPAAALELLHGYMIEAVQAIAEVMRRSPDDKMILQAAGEILDRGGMPKSSRQEKNVNETTNVNVTDDGLIDALRNASPEVQEQAAQLMEGLESLLQSEAEREIQGVSDEEN